jgi:hypothetical protein
LRVAGSRGEHFVSPVDDAETGGHEMNPRDHIGTSLSIEPDDFDYAPFRQRDGLGKARQLFGEELPELLEKLNSASAT